MQRILSISGLRGIIGDGLDPSYIVKFASALGTKANGGTVVISRDGRSTGHMVKHAVISALISTGCKVLDADIVSTPTCGVLITHFQADAGLQITASHNPVQWNGLKPFTPEGSVFDAAHGKTLLDIMNSESYDLKSWDQLGTVEVLENPSEIHKDKVCSLINVETIRQRKLKVVLDCNRGSGAILGPEFLEHLGCEVIVLGGKADGQFEHVPEPLEENLTGLSEAVLKHGADVGFAQDPDADRLAIVDNTGRYIGEELTLALCVDHVLAKTPGPVVVNGSTSRVTADIAEKYGCEFHRSHVGEANVVAKMNEVKAIIGGEGNGGVIDPHIGFVRDSFMGMGYVLEGITEKKKPLSEWVDDLPSYCIVKNKITCPAEQVGIACDVLRKTFSDAKPTEGDGLRLDWDNQWVQVRASNTEPIIRIIAEAPASDEAHQLVEKAMTAVKNALE